MHLFLKNNIKPISLLVVIFSAFIITYTAIDFALLKSFVELKINQLKELGALSPFYLVLCFAILPMFGVPVSPFCILAGMVYGGWVGGLAALLGLLINSMFIYTAVTLGIKAPIEKFLVKRGYRTFNLSPSSALMTTIIVRATPLFPFAIQNYLLSLAGAPLLPYFLSIIPVQLIWISLFVSSGEAILESNTVMLVSLASALVAASLIAKMLGNKLKHRLT